MTTQDRPRKRRSLPFRILRAAGIGIAALIVLSIIGAALTSGHKTPAAATSPAPSTSKTAKATPQPAVTRTARATPRPTVTVTETPPAPAPAATTQAPALPADTILARFSGTGTGNTTAFTVPADGLWHLSWAYTNGSLFAGQAENFQVYEYDAATGQPVGVLVNQLAAGTGQPTADPVYDQGEAGQRVYLTVNTEDANWSLVAVSGAS